jgi:hypothetical protein
MGAFNTGFDTVNLHRPTTEYSASITSSVTSSPRTAGRQWLTLVHVRAQLEQLQDTLMI